MLPLPPCGPVAVRPISGTAPGCLPYGHLSILPSSHRGYGHGGSLTEHPRLRHSNIGGSAVPALARSTRFHEPQALPLSLTIPPDIIVAAASPSSPRKRLAVRRPGDETPGSFTNRPAQPRTNNPLGQTVLLRDLGNGPLGPNLPLQQLTGETWNLGGWTPAKTADIEELHTNLRR